MCWSEVIFKYIILSMTYSSSRVFTGLPVVVVVAVVGAVRGLLWRICGRILSISCKWC